MIDKQYEKYVVVCDICGEIMDDKEFETWDQAVESETSSCWRIKSQSGKIKNYCPKCQMRRKLPWNLN